MDFEGTDKPKTYTPEESGVYVYLLNSSFF